ncbi:MAG: hypothetical protein ACP5OR_00060 [Candidatus Dormibacteria bacterium]
MAEEVREAERERDEQRNRLAKSVGELEKQVRQELDWKKRLPTDGARIAVVTVTSISVVLSLVALRRMFRSSPRTLSNEDNTYPEYASLEELSSEIHAMRNQLNKLSVKKSGGLGRALVLRLVTAAGTAAGTLIAKRVIERMGTDTDDLYGG